MKKFLSLILSIVMILSLSSTVFAAENTEYQEYTNLVDIGVLGDDNMDLTSTDKTYCSKLVWQAYYYGPDTHCANGPTVGVRLPYDLPSTIHDLSLVQTYEKTS